MDKFRKYAHDVLDALYKISAIALLVVIAVQTTVASKAYNAQSWENQTAQVFEIDKIFISNPDLYPYFYSDARIAPGDMAYPKVAVMAELYLDLMDSFEDPSAIELMKDDPVAWDAWKNWFVGLFQETTIMCPVYNEMRDSYIKGGVLAKLAAEGCAGKI